MTSITASSVRASSAPIGTSCGERGRRGADVLVDEEQLSGLCLGGQQRDVPEESLMLTGDENIVDVDFTVLWRIKPDGVGNYLFNIQNPEVTVKEVAESAMREVVGQQGHGPEVVPGQPCRVPRLSGGVGLSEGHLVAQVVEVPARAAQLVVLPVLDHAPWLPGGLARPGA